MPRVGSRRRKSRTQKSVEADAGSDATMTMVVKHGEVSSKLGQLVRDLRVMLSPCTYGNLRDSKRAKLRDYVKAAKELRSTSLISVSGGALKFARLSEGPTAEFRVSGFSLGHDVRVSARLEEG